MSHDLRVSSLAANNNAVIPTLKAITLSENHKVRNKAVTAKLLLGIQRKIASYTVQAGSTYSMMMQYDV